MIVCYRCKEKEVGSHNALCGNCVLKDTLSDLPENVQRYRESIKGIETSINNSSAKFVITFSQAITAVEKVVANKEKHAKSISGILKSMLKPEETPVKVGMRITKSETVIMNNEMTIRFESKQGKTFTRTISGGNYDFMGGVESGYNVSVYIYRNDELLLPIVMKILRSMKFACHISGYSIAGHQTDWQPTLAGEREFLKEFNEKLTAVLSPIKNNQEEVKSQ